MRYAGLIKNDFVNGEGVSVSLFTQGCPFRCEGCHNPESWNFEGGVEIDKDVLIAEILRALGANGVLRNLSILGGEPLCETNRSFVKLLIYKAKLLYPEIKVYLWTGYEKDQLSNEQSEAIGQVDVLIDGPFILSQRDITLPLRGSRNQNIYRRDEDGRLTKEENNI